jgi:hypothetical protein
MTWSDVNSPLPPDQFAEPSIDAPQGTYFSDIQSGSRATVAFPYANEKKGEEVFSSGLLGASVRERPQIPPARARQSDPISPEGAITGRRSSRIIWLFALTGMLSLLGYAALRRTRKST